LKKDDFIALVNNPALATAAALAQLREVEDSYPYFQSAKVLLAKTLHNENDISYDRVLKRVAASVPDRRRLYEIIHPTETAPLKDDAAQVTEPTAAEESPAEAVAELPVEPVIEEVTTAATETVVEAETLEQVVQQPIAETTADPIQSAEIAAVETPGPTTIKPIIISLTDDTPKAEGVEKIEEPTAEDKPEELNLPAFVPDIDYLSLLEKQAPIEEHPLPTGIEETEEEATIANDAAQVVVAQVERPVVEAEGANLSFTAWLDFIKDHPIKDEPKPVAKKPQTANANDLVSRFIAAEPKIVPKKAEFFSPANMAKKSVVDDEEIVSETLARIYALQGNIPKAIRIYEKLSLLSTEKSGYFAALIENLKQKEQ
jgi:hypothetical protein